MELIKNMSEFFLIALSLGTGSFTVLANTKKTGVGVFKLMTSVCMGALIIGLVIHLGSSHWNSKLSIVYYISLINLLLQYLFHKDVKSRLMWLLYFFQIIFGSSMLILFINKVTVEISLINYFQFFSSTFYLGVIMYSMLLGHWYLVTPKLSERPLIKSTLILWTIMVVKLIALVILISQNLNFFQPGSDLGVGYMFNWIVLLMRVGWGYLVIGILSYFSWRLIRMRSIQSATGVLYVMVFFSFFGELAASYLFFKYQLFI